MVEFAYEFDEARSEMKTLGLVVLQSDETIEHDFRRMLPTDIALHVSRIPNQVEVTRETLGEMEHSLPASINLMPEGLAFDAVGYGCTSGTSVIGPERIAELVHSRGDVKQVSEPVSALLAACEELDIKKLAFLSPYIETVSAGLRNVLNENGVETPVFGSFNEGNDSKVVRISSKSVYDAAVTLGLNSGCDALFMSCTNLRTLEVIEKIEDTLGMPVLSSNQVLAWHLARLSGIDLKANGYGRLLS